MKHFASWVTYVIIVAVLSIPLALGIVLSKSESVRMICLGISLLLGFAGVFRSGRLLGFINNLGLFPRIYWLQSFQNERQKPSAAHKTMVILLLIVVSAISSAAAAYATLMILKGGASVTVNKHGGVSVSKAGMYELWVDANHGTTSSIIRDWSGAQLIKNDGKAAEKETNFFQESSKHNGDKRLRVCYFVVTSPGDYQLYGQPSADMQSTDLEAPIRDLYKFLAVIAYPLAAIAMGTAVALLWLPSIMRM